MKSIFFLQESSRRSISTRPVFFLIAVLYALFVSSLYADISIHVSLGGNDRDDGSAEKPVRSPRRAVQLAAYRDEPAEIVFHGGVYSGEIVVGKAQERLEGGRQPLVIRAAEGEEVIFDGSRPVTEAEHVEGKTGVYKIRGKYSYRYLIHVWEADTRKRYTLAADLAAVEQFPASFWFSEKDEEVFFHTSDNQPPEKHEIAISQYRNGATLWRPNTTIKGITLRNYLAWHWSCGVELRAPDTTAENCRVWNCYRGFQIMMTPPRTKIIGCRVDDCGGGVYSQGKRALVERCELYKIRDSFMVPTYSQDDCAIQFYYPAEEGEVRHNLCVGFGSGIFVKCPTSQFTVAHNTCLDGRRYGIGCTSWHPQTIFRYNIVTGYIWPILRPGSIKPSNDVDYNCLWGIPEGGALKACLEKPRQVGTGQHTIFADPRFAAPAAGDYRLLPDSPCASFGTNGKTCGAFDVVGDDFKDVQPPVVKLAASPPAKRAGGTGELYFERDPWIGGGRNLIRKLESSIRSSGSATGQREDWVTPQNEVTLEIDAQDYVSKAPEMKTKVGGAAWGEPEPFQARKTVILPDGKILCPVSICVSDAAGNWSSRETLMFRIVRKGPELRTSPVLYTNGNGVVISFQTTSPCLARVEFGLDAKYGSVFEQPPGVQRTWLANDGGDWVEIRSRPRVSNYLVLLPPLVESGKTYHYRLVLEDEAGNKTFAEEATFAVTGAPRVYYLSPKGEDADGRGTKEAPWRTVQFAVDRALPGDRVVLMPGLYPGETTLSHGGIDGAPITIEAQEQGTVILDGRHESKSCLNLNKAPYIVINGFEIRWFKRAGIYIADSPHVSVLNCKIWNNFWMGWPTGSGIFAHRSAGLVADHNLMFELEEGIYLLQSPSSRLTYNTINKNMYGAAKFVYSAANSVSKNNCFAFSGNDQYLVVTQNPEEFETFVSDYNNLGTKLRRPEPGDEIEPKEFLLRHHGSKAVISLNGNRYNSLREWQKVTGKDQHSIFADPLFIHVEGWNFHVQPDSPNISAGENGTTIGAFGAEESGKVRK